MITVMRFSRKLKNPNTVLMAVPAKSVTHEVWMFFRISPPRLLISGSLKSVYCATKSQICW